jgi:hypothetical protein
MTSHTSAGSDACDRGHARPTQPTSGKQGASGRKTDEVIDEAVEESFPASDPPAFSGSTAAPTVKSRPPK